MLLYMRKRPPIQSGELEIISSIRAILRIYNEFSLQVNVIILLVVKT